MNFNKANFTEETVEHNLAKIRMIHQCEQISLKVVIDFLLSTNDINQQEGFKSLIHLIIKMRFNLEAANVLQDQLADDYRFKTSINLLYRASIDDLVNIYYLMGFIFMNSNDQQSLNNELDIMHRDFLSSAAQIIESEIETEGYANELAGLPHDPSRTPSDWKDSLIKANSHLYDVAKNKWKSNKQIRSSSNMILAPFPDGQMFISESAKIKFIKQRGFSRHALIKQLFKYFSQYQHFSPKMHDFLLTSPETELTYYHRTLVEMLCVVSAVNMIIESTDREKNTKSLEDAIVQIITAMNDFNHTEAPSADPQT